MRCFICDAIIKDHDVVVNPITKEIEPCRACSHEEELPPHNFIIDNDIKREYTRISFVTELLKGDTDV